MPRTNVSLAFCGAPWNFLVCSWLRLQQTLNHVNYDTIPSSHAQPADKDWEICFSATLSAAGFTTSSAALSLPVQLHTILHQKKTLYVSIPSSHQAWGVRQLVIAVEIPLRYQFRCPNPFSQKVHFTEYPTHQKTFHRKPFSQTAHFTGILWSVFRWTVVLWNVARWNGILWTVGTPAFHRL